MSNQTKRKITDPNEIEILTEAEAQLIIKDKNKLIQALLFEGKLITRICFTS